MTSHVRSYILTMALMMCLVASMVFVVTPEADAAGNLVASGTTVNQYVNVLVNGQPLQSDVKPFINADGRTMLPVRAIAEALGAQVQWDDATQTATLTQGINTVKVTIGQKAITINGYQVPMDTAAVIKDDRTLLPVRAVGEALGAEISWDEATYTVNIGSNGNNSISNNNTSPLIGSWSSLASSSTGMLVDPATGFANGSYYSGEWYFFKPDGTCRYDIIGSGTIISGIAEVLSNYQVEGNQIIFTNQRESFTPFPNDTSHTAVKDNPVDDETHTFIYNPADDTLIIDDISTFYRIDS